MARTVHVIRMRLVVEVVSQASLNGLVICEALHPERNGIRPALVMPNPVLSIQTGPVLHSQEPCIRRRCWMICRIIKPNQFHHLPWCLEVFQRSGVQSSKLGWSLQITMRHAQGWNLRKELWSDTVRGSHWGVPLDSHEIWLQHSSLAWNFFHDVFGKCRICYWGVGNIPMQHKKRLT